MNWWIVWFVAYIIGIYAVGIYYARKIDSADKYIMADFSLGFFPIAGSIVATTIGAATVIGATGKGFTYGMSWGIVTSPVMIFSLLLVAVLGITIRKLKLYTIPDLLVRRYGKIAGLIPAFIISIVYMTPAIGMQILGMGAILATILDIPFFWAMLLGFALCIGFTLLGGLPSVAWTDGIQAVLIVGGLFVMMIMGVIHVGGAGEIIAHTPKQMLDLWDINKQELINFALIFGPFYLVWQTTWQRLASAQTEKVAIRAVSAGFIITFICGFFAIIIGITARLVLPADLLPALVYSEFITEVFHPNIGGLFLVALFATLLTGATSFLLSGATNIVKDIYQPWINPLASDTTVLLISRISVVLIGLLGLGSAFIINDLLSIYMYALSLSAVTMLCPIIAAMFWKGATKTGVLTSIIGSSIFTLLWNFAGRPWGIHEIIPGLIVSLVLLVEVSLYTEHAPEEEVIAYYFSLKNEKKHRDCVSEGLPNL